MRTHILALIFLLICAFSGQAGLEGSMVLVGEKPALVPGLGEQPLRARVPKLEALLKETVKAHEYPLAGLSYNRYCMESLWFPLNPFDVFIAHLFPDRYNAVPNQQGIEPLSNITPKYLKNIMQALVEANREQTFNQVNLFNNLAEAWGVKLSGVTLAEGTKFAEFYSENRDFWQYFQQKNVIEHHIDGVNFWNLHRLSPEAIALWSMRWIFGKNQDALNYERAMRWVGRLKKQPEGMDYVHNTSRGIAAFNQKRREVLAKTKSEKDKFTKNMQKLCTIDAIVQAFEIAENRQKMLEFWDLFAWGKLKDKKGAALYLGVSDQDSIQILGMQEFQDLHKAFAENEDVFWQWPAAHKQFYIDFSSQNTAFKPAKYSQARVGENIFSDCVETALFDVITHSLAEKREGMIYLNCERLKQDTPMFQYLQEFPDMAANRAGKARDERAKIVSNLPANLGIRYDKYGCELHSSASTLANAMIYLLGLTEQRPLSERASRSQIQATYDAIGHHLGVSFGFEGEIVTLQRDGNPLGYFQITPGKHIEYKVQDALEGESSFTSLFGKVKTYEDTIALAGVADADSYLTLQKAVRGFGQALTPSQDIEIYQAFASQANTNEARILAAYEGFRVLPKKSETSPNTHNERESVLRTIQGVTKELSDANDQATIKKLHEHLNLNYMQGHMKSISQAEFAQIISTAPNLFRLVDYRVPIVLKGELVTKLGIQGTFDIAIGDLRVAIANSAAHIFADEGSDAAGAIAETCQTLYVNPNENNLEEDAFKGVKTIGFNPCQLDSDLEANITKLMQTNPVEVRLFGLAEDDIMEVFLDTLAQNESRRFKMLSLGDNTLFNGQFEIDDTTCQDLMDWIDQANERLNSFVTKAFRILPNDTVINFGYTMEQDKLDEVMNYAHAHKWPLERLRVEVWHSDGDNVDRSLEDDYHRHGVKDRNAPVFQTFSGGFAREVEEGNLFGRLLGL